MHSGYLFVDTETTGLYPDKHGIVQIAAILTKPNFEIESFWMSYCRPGSNILIDDEALEVNGLTRDQLETFSDERMVARAFLDFANIRSDLKFAGYNCPFDLSFLDVMVTRHGWKSPSYAMPWLDVLNVARKQLSITSYKLTAVCEYLGIECDGAHSAMVDIYATLKVARKLLTD